MNRPQTHLSSGWLSEPLDALKSRCFGICNHTSLPWNHFFYCQNQGSLRNWCVISFSQRQNVPPVLVPFRVEVPKDWVNQTVAGHGTKPKPNFGMHGVKYIKLSKSKEKWRQAKDKLKPNKMSFPCQDYDIAHWTSQRPRRSTSTPSRPWFDHHVWVWYLQLLQASLCFDYLMFVDPASCFATGDWSPVIWVQEEKSMHHHSGTLSLGFSLDPEAMVHVISWAKRVCIISVLTFYHCVQGAMSGSYSWLHRAWCDLEGIANKVWTLKAQIWTLNAFSARFLQIDSGCHEKSQFCRTPIVQELNVNDAYTSSAERQGCNVAASGPQNRQWKVATVAVLLTVRLEFGAEGAPPSDPS